MSTPSRPTTPYISLDDPNMSDFFTKSRLQKHLRKAGLLNRNGEILTQAEYESKQTDVAIGRENRRKIDEAITEVLNEMSREHGARMREDLEKTKNDLHYQFRRIQEQFRRRTWRIAIRHAHDGQVKVEPDEPISDNQSSVIGDSTESLTSLSTLPPIQSGDHSQRPHSSRLPNTGRLNDLDDIRQQLNDLRKKLANFDRKINTQPRNPTNDDALQRIERLLIRLEKNQDITQRQQEKLNKTQEEDKKRIDALDQRFESFGDQRKPTGLDGQKVDHLINSSTIIKELRDSIFNLEISFHNSLAGRTQEPIVKPNEINEGKSIDLQQHIIEKLIGDTNEKIKRIEDQFAQLSKRLEMAPTPITHADVNQAIQNEIPNLKRTLQDTNEGQNLANQANNKANQLENQFNQLSQSTRVYITRPAVEELINQAILKQQSIPKTDTYLEQRFNDLEHRFNAIPSLPDLGLVDKRLTQLENRPLNVDNHPISRPVDDIRQILGRIQLLQEQINELNGKKLDLQAIPQTLDEIEQRSQQSIGNLTVIIRQQIDDLRKDTIDRLNTKPDHQILDKLKEELIRDINGQTDGLRQSINENKRVMAKMQEKLAHFSRQSDQQPTTTSPLFDKSKIHEDPSSHHLTSKELQTIMPFIELLPTFDMFKENEWN